MFPVFVSSARVVRKSHRMRTPRSDAAQRVAIAAAVRAPSSMAVKRSSSRALLRAADCSNANSVSKTTAGEGVACVVIKRTPFDQFDDCAECRGSLHLYVECVTGRDDRTARDERGPRPRG